MEKSNRHETIFLHKKNGLNKWTQDVKPGKFGINSWHGLFSLQLGDYMSGWENGR
jgi:hypothetical protein